MIEGWVIQDLVFAELVCAALERLAVFGDASGDAFAPHSKAARFEGPAHVLNDLGFGESGAFADLVKAGAVVPCHADDCVGGFRGQLNGFHVASWLWWLRFLRQASEQ